MNCFYNIYRQLPDNQLVWVEGLNALDLATDRARKLCAALPGNYLVFDVRQRTVVDVWDASRIS